MIFNIYAIKDEVADEFRAPVPFLEKRSDEVAERWFKQAIKDNEQPSDYSLWRIGSYNNDTAYLEREETPHLIARGE